jgi:cytochrome P450
MQSNSQSTIENQGSTLFGNPFPWYAKMRCESPMFYDAEQESWMVFGYEDVKHVFANWQVFSSKIPHPPEQTDFTESMNYTDPPKHQTLRSLVAKVFTARRVEELAPRIQKIAHELIDRVEKCDRMDFIHDFASPLPVILIAEILGVPTEDREDFKQWSDGIVVLNPLALEAMANYFRRW